jgi:hypothetical protein
MTTVFVLSLSLTWTTVHDLVIPFFRKRKLVSVVDNCGMLIGQQNLKRGVDVNCATKTRHREMKLGCKQCDI